jgi:hypothetical protein
MSLILRFLTIAAFLAVAGNAYAQQPTAKVIAGCGTAAYAAGSSAPTTQNQVGQACINSVPVEKGAGSLSVTTGSALINTMTVTYGALPTAWSALTITDVGSSDVAVCAQGGTCTCAANGIAATNGTTIKSGGGYVFQWPTIVAATPSIVACSAMTAVDFVF